MLRDSHIGVKQHGFGNQGLKLMSAQERIIEIFMSCLESGIINMNVFCCPAFLDAHLFHGEGAMGRTSKAPAAFINGDRLLLLREV